MTTVLCWNLWFGGREIESGRAKQAELISRVAPDVAIVQECFGDGGEELADRLGWRARQQSWDNAVLTAHPSKLLGTDTRAFGTAAAVELPGLGLTLVWSVHLWFDDYGPYATAQGADQDAVDALPGEERRVREIELILAETDRMLGTEVPAETPVIIAGDFNCPSSDDWAARTDRVDVSWRAVDRLHEAGYTDAFRAVHPDAAVVGGETWSAIEADHEPLDRIDFVFVRGVEVKEVRVLGAAPANVHGEKFADASWFDNYGGTCEPIPHQRDNSFASDHQALVVKLARVR